MTMDYMNFEDDRDDLLNSSLTNLQWLQHINMNLSEGLQSVPKKTVASSSYNSSTSVHHKEERGRSTVDYSRNTLVKPPYSYATLICMAIRETAKHKITLSAIYNWIMSNFAYYRNADPSWQNSIRHNLSLNKCFLKVPRNKDEPGKGGFWMINSQYEDYFTNGVFKNRKNKKRIETAPYTKSGPYRMNVYNPGKARPRATYQTIEVCNKSVIRIPSINFNCSQTPKIPEAPRPQHTVQRTCPNSLKLNMGTRNLNTTTLNSSTNSSTINTVEDHTWDLVLKDIQLNSAYDGEMIKKAEDEFFRDTGLNLDSLNEDLTSPELNDLVRDIESLIDIPSFQNNPELIIKGEKLSSTTLDSLSSNNPWGNLLDDLNIGGISDYLDSPLNGLV